MRFTLLSYSSLFAHCFVIIYSACFPTLSLYTYVTYMQLMFSRCQCFHSLRVWHRCRKVVLGSSHTSAKTFNILYLFRHRQENKLCNFFFIYYTQFCFCKVLLFKNPLGYFLFNFQNPGFKILLPHCNH